MVSRNVRKITLALVGHGQWGTNYIKTLSSMTSCVLPTKYIVSRSYKSLAKYRDIDGVIIATPAGTHYEIAKFFLENNFNILVEKPVTLDYKQAVTLVGIQKKNQLVGMVGHIYEFHPDFQALVDKVDKANIEYIYSEGVGAGPIRQDVTALWDWAPHDIGMCIRILGTNPIAVSCWEQVQGAMYFIKLVFPSGVIAVSRVGSLSPQRKRSLLVYDHTTTHLFEDKNSTVSTRKKLPLQYEVEEFVSCVLERRSSTVDLSHGAAVVRVIACAQKSLDSEGKMVQL